jgi:hypothetical protein
MSLVVGSAGPDCYRIVTRSGGVPELAESVGELAAQLLVLVCEFTVAAQRKVEALAQRVVAGTLAGRGCGGMFGLVAGAQAPDLVVEVGLAVEPGARDSGFSELRISLRPCGFRVLCVWQAEVDGGVG